LLFLQGVRRHERRQLSFHGPGLQYIVVKERRTNERKVAETMVMPESEVVESVELLTLLTLLNLLKLLNLLTPQAARQRRSNLGTNERSAQDFGYSGFRQRIGAEIVPAPK
jgi:hypothetical protein